MTIYNWEYGSSAVGLLFTITYNDSTHQFTVNVIEGAMDLNALWFSDGKKTSDGYTLTKSDNSLNMNGSAVVWDEGTSDLEKITWDDYQKTSSTGITNDGFYLTAGQTKTFLADAETLAWFAKVGADSTILGVRATSTSTSDGGIKWADEAATATPAAGTVVVLNTSGMVVGTYTDIQSAVNVALDGYSVLVGTGAFTGDVTIARDISLEGMGLSTDVVGSIFVKASGVSISQLEVVATGKSYGVELLADSATTYSNVSLNGIKVSGATEAGVELHNNVSVTDMTMTNVTLTGNGVGLRSASGVGIDGLTITGGTIADNATFGILTNGGNAGGATIRDVTIDGTTFTNNGADWTGPADNTPNNGDLALFSYTGDALTLKNLTFTTETRSSIFVGGNGQDIDGFVFTNIGVTASTAFRVVKLEGLAVDAQSFETLLQGITPSGTAGTDYKVFAELAGSAGSDNIVGTGRIDLIKTSDGNDQLTGGAGDDYLQGGTGTDTANYATKLTASMVTTEADAYPYNGTTDAGWKVTTGGADGTDRLTGIEILDDGDDSEIFLVGNGGFTSIADAQAAAAAGKLATGDTVLVNTGGSLVWNGTAWDATVPANTVWLFNASGIFESSYATIQGAIDASATGYKVVVGSGTFADTININKSITLIGVDVGVEGDGVRAQAGSVISGKITVNAAAMIDGFKILNTTANTAPYDAIQVQTSGDVTIRNNVFFSEGPNGSNTTIDRAVYLTTAATGNIVVDDNLFTGNATTNYGDANWTSAVWSDGRSTTLVISDNKFEHVRTAMNLDGYDSSKVTVTGNDISSAGSGVTVGSNAVETVVTFAGITNNTFGAVDTDFNLQNIGASKSVSLDLGQTSNLATAGQTMVVLGSGGGDTIVGTSGSDMLNGRGANDMLNGGGGDDVLLGDTGTDTAIYTVSLIASMVTTETDANPYLAGDQAGWKVTTGGADGTDRLTGIEILDHGDTSEIFLVGNGGFASIADAQAAAAAGGSSGVLATGDTILVSTGGSLVYDATKMTWVAHAPDATVWLLDNNGGFVNSYSSIESAYNAASNGYDIYVGAGTFAIPNTDLDGLVISKSVGLYGAQHGVSAINGVRPGGESIIQSWLGTNQPYAAITIKADGVTVDGFTITNFFRDGITVQQSSAETTVGSGISLRQDINIENNYIYKALGVGNATSNGLLFGENTTNNTNLTLDAILDDLVISGNYIDVATSSGRPIAFGSQFRGVGGSMTVSDMVMTDNTVQASGSGASVFQAQYGAQFFTNAAIADNVVLGSFSMLGMTGSSITGNDFHQSVFVGLQTSLIDGNIFNASSGSSYALYLEGTANNNPTPSSLVTISNNSFTFNDEAVPSSIGYGSGITYNVDPATCTVTANTFTDAGTVGWLITENEMVRQTGTTGPDSLSGSSQSDFIRGDNGNDTLAGNGGTDYFVFTTTPNVATNTDTVSDFTAGTDMIVLSSATYTMLAPKGALSADSFVSGASPVAADANDYILYDTATGALYYDADGSGAGAAVQFATLSGAPALASTDIWVV